MGKEILSLARNIYISNFKRLALPYKLTLALTNRCNSKCKLCHIWKKRKYAEELTLGEIETFFKINNYFNWIDLTGGEVYLRKDLVEVAKLILEMQKRLVLFHIPTNGLLTKKIIQDTKTILKFKPRRFLISVALDGPEKIHDDLRGVSGNWKKAVQTYQRLKKLKSSRFNCYFGMTLSKYNYDLIEEAYLNLKEEIPDLNRRDLHFNIAHQSKHYYHNQNKNVFIKKEFIDNLEEFKKKKKINISVVQFLENAYQNLISVYLKTGKTPADCQALSASIFVDPQGNIYPCGMWNKKITNLKEINYNIKSIWGNDEVKILRKKIRNKECSNCWTPCEAYQSILGSLFSFLKI